MPIECNCLELSRLLGVDRKTIINWTKRGLRASKFSQSGQWTIRSSDLEAFLVQTNRLSKVAN